MLSAALILSVTSALPLRAPARGAILSTCSNKPWKGCPEVAFLRSRSVGGSFAARWARMVLKRCSSERGEREKRFYGDGKGERRRTAL